MIDETAALTSDGFCPLARAAKLIGDVWVLLIVKQLLDGPKRFCQLEDLINEHQDLGNISTRTLSQRLKMLEEEKIINRKVYKETPPHSEYSLTQKGESLSSVIEEIRQYGKKYLA